MKFRFHRLLFVFVAIAVHCSADPVSKGFDALLRFDYFKARELFLKKNRKAPNTYACYGLATIYYRNDNPFHDIDSAVKYLNFGWQAFHEAPEARSFGSYAVNQRTYRVLADSISQVAYTAALRTNEPGPIDYFLAMHFLAPSEIRQRAMLKRDQLELSQIRSVNQSTATARFLLLHPGSPTFEEATTLFHRQVFEESTKEGTAQAFIEFLRRHRSNKMAKLAYEKLYGMYSRDKNAEGLALFVKEFPEAPQALEAWKLLFSLSVKNYNYTELKKFLDQYPDFPLRNSILEELELNKLVRYPFMSGELTGYIDESGSWKIPALYESASEFRIGLAVVHRGDSAAFINKENSNPFNRWFDEAYNFNNGMAAVKKKGQWHFINRLGQTIYGPYDEVNEISDGIYVIRKGDRYGALDQFLQPVIEPRFEKLGDFVNGFAYYTEEGRYGFVRSDGQVHPPEFGWVSDFTTWRQAVIKVAGKFGLIDHSGRQLLDPVYEQVLKQNDSVFLVVKGEHYGFYHASGCFLFAPAFDYLMSVQSGRFTDGDHFKLNRRKQQAIANGNGSLLVAFGAFDEAFVPSDGLMRIKKKGKTGYADLSGKMVIPAIYEQGHDFENGVALVVLKGRNVLLARNGRQLFESDAEIARLGRKHFVTAEVPSKIVGPDGSVLFADAENIQQVAPGVYAFERRGGEIRFLYE